MPTMQKILAIFLSTETCYLLLDDSFCYTPGRRLVGTSISVWLARLSVLGSRSSSCLHRFLHLLVFAL
jgi:hypothetical protein